MFLRAANSAIKIAAIAAINVNSPLCTIAAIL